MACAGCRRRLIPNTMSDIILDCLGLKCPLPVLKARKRLREMRQGEVLVVLADDPIAPLDLEHMVQEDGHIVLEMITEDGKTRARLEKGDR